MNSDNLRYFKNRPALGEVAHARDTMASNNQTNVNTKFYYTREERFSEIILSSLTNFLGIFKWQRSEGDKGDGRQTVEDQNAYNAIMAVFASNDLDAAKLGQMLSRKLNVSRR